MTEKTCPACLSIHTSVLAGDEFGECEYCGTIFARNRRTTVRYDAAYVTARTGQKTNKLSVVREETLYSLLRLYEIIPSGQVLMRTGKLLDVGYGDGDFLRHVWKKGWTPYGYDVNPSSYTGFTAAELPNLPEFPVNYRVITFFNSLEHFEDLLEARWCSHHTDWLLISFPHTPDDFPYNKDWIDYRPGEHHLFFRPQSLPVIFSHNGVTAELVYKGNPEDCVTGPLKDGRPNTCTVALRCYKETQ